MITGQWGEIQSRQCGNRDYFSTAMTGSIITVFRMFALTKGLRLSFLFGLGERVFNNRFARLLAANVAQR